MPAYETLSVSDLISPHKPFKVAVFIILQMKTSDYGKLVTCSMSHVLWSKQGSGMQMLETPGLSSRIPHAVSQGSCRAR